MFLFGFKNDLKVTIVPKNCHITVISTFLLITSLVFSQFSEQNTKQVSRYDIMKYTWRHRFFVDPDPEVQFFEKTKKPFLDCSRGVCTKFKVYSIFSLVRGSQIIKNTHRPTDFTSKNWNIPNWLYTSRGSDLNTNRQLNIIQMWL